MDYTNQNGKAKDAYNDVDTYHDSCPTNYGTQCTKYFLHKLGILSTNDELLHNDSLTILELGCGTGFLTGDVLNVLKGKGNIRYIATDPLESMKNTFVQTFPDVEFYLCKAENLPLPDNSVDVIVAASCIHWFANQTAYEEMYRVLKPGGMLGQITQIPSQTAGPDWVNEMFKLLWGCYRETETPFFYDYKWKDALLSSGIFKDYKEECPFAKWCFEADVDKCVNFFSAFGGVASGSQQLQSQFRSGLTDVLETHFTKKGIEFSGVRLMVQIATCKTAKKE